jgi:3-methyl-2-oxobutanoate hydroxymethyltransferase
VEVLTIGIGAGPQCDAQVLVWQDMAGLTSGRLPRYVKRYTGLERVLASPGESGAGVCREVRTGALAADEHSYQ